MRIQKAGWVSHDGQPLFSVDVHPDGRRFATGGQGGEGGSGRVAIWDLRLLIENNEDKSGLLTLMDHHLGCVNVVRFSASGHRLASAGDDKIVMIWRQSEFGAGSSIFGSSSLTHVESWRCEHTLRAHSGDILDLAWGLDDALLATASVDNSVIVWNALRWPEVVAKLSDHAGLVKGVAFDPVGSFLASQADDKKLRIWRTSDWKLEAVVSEPFQDTGPTTHVLRLHWSPEGSMLVSANADNCGGPTAAIIGRSSWKSGRDFVGHTKAVTCVKFSSNVYFKPSKSNSHFTRVALGSRDRSISVWSTDKKRPWFVVSDLFDQSVLDLSWSRDGQVLLACSMDGTVGAIILKGKEVGTKVDSKAFSMHMEAVYGECYKRDKLAQFSHHSHNINNNKIVIVEDPELMLKQKELNASDKVDRSKESDRKSANQKKQNEQVMVKKTAIVRGPTDRQIEARTTDGKRRITPIFIPNDARASGNNNTANLSNGNTNGVAIDDIFGCSNSSALPPSDFGSSSTQEKSTIAIEKRDEVVPVAVGSQRWNSSASKEPQAIENGRIQSEEEKDVNQKQSKVTPITEIQVNATSGKSQEIVPQKDDEAKVIEVRRKRVAAICSSSSDDEEPPTKQMATAATKTKPASLSRSFKTPKATMPTTTTTTTTVCATTITTTSTGKRLESRVDIASQQLSSQSSSVTKRAGSTDVYYNDGGGETQVIFSDEIVLPALRISPCVGGQPRCFQFPKAGISVDIFNNYFSANNNILHMVRLRRDQQTLGKDILLPSASSAVAADSHFLIITCLDSTLHVYKQEKGAVNRLCPPMKLPSLVAKLSLQGSRLAVVTASAKFFLWTLNSKTSKVILTMRNECIQSLFQLESGGFEPRRIKIAKLFFSPLGQPIVVTTQGKAFVHDKNLGLWIQLISSSDSLRQVSSYSSSSTTNNDKSDFLPLRRLCLQSGLGQSDAQSTSSVPSHLQLMADLNYCELQMASATYLGSSVEKYYWLKAKVRHLVAAEETEALRDILTGLWKSGEEGKKKVLRELLDVVAQNLSMQRIYQEFKEILQNEESEFAALKDLV